MRAGHLFMTSKPNPAESAPTGSAINQPLLIDGRQPLNVGISIYDAEFRLVSCNKRFQEIFDLPDEMVQIGTPLAPLLRLHAERGEFGSVESDKFVCGTLELLRNMEGPLTFERRRSNGIYFESTASRLEGGGYITIHSDITHRKQREAELRQIRTELEARVLERTAELQQRERELLEEKAIFNSYLETLRQGIAVVDKDLKLRIGNRALINLLEFPEDLVVPGTPFEKVARFNAEQGNYGPGDVDELVQRRMALARNPTHYRVEQVRHNDIVLDVCGDPMPGGGFVTTYTDITERKQAEARLLESRNQLDEAMTELELILRNAYIGVLTVVPDKDGGRRVMRRVNLALEQMLGYEHGELEGLSTRSLYPSDEEFEAVSSGYTRIVCTGQTYQGEHVFIRKDGQTIVGNLRGSAIDPEDPGKGAIWLVEDISERKRIEAELAAKTELLKAGTDNMPGAMVIWDKDLRYVLWTPRADEYFNLAPGTLKAGLPLIEMARYFAERGDFGPGDIEEQIEMQMRPFYEKEIMHIERHMPNGTVLEVRRNPLPSGGFVSVFQDITERKRMEAELLKAKEAAELAADAIRHKREQVASLLDSSGQGFLSFGGNLLVDSEYSRACVSMLGQAPAARDAAKMLFADNETYADLLRTLIPKVLAEPDLLKRDMMLSQLPKEFLRGDKHLKVEFKMQDNGHVMAVLTDITDEKKLIRLSLTDRLTGLFNRRKLDEALVIEHERANRSNQPFALIIADVDKFKEVNDIHGHQVGDQVLVELAEILRRGIRKIDTVGRWGGEEFMILCPNTDLGGARELAEKIRLAVEAHVFPVVCHKTSSFGVAEYQIGEETELMIKRADEGLYRAKNSGRNQVVAV